jgi:hypothetical protein
MWAEEALFLVSGTVAGASKISWYIIITSEA